MSSAVGGRRATASGVADSSRIVVETDARLVYADLASAGYSRVRRGRGFSFLGKRGKPLKRRSLIDYCRSIVIPPAWQDVWISPVRNAHILSTGLDAAGRKQYVYHPDWTRIRNTRKFDDLPEFARHLPVLREQIECDLRAFRHSRTRVVATAVGLIDRGLIRVGNETYTRLSGTRGATTLEERHVDVSGSEIVLDFRGKSGKRRHLEIDDDALARSIRYCQELPGQRLFQYRDDDGSVARVDSSDVNDYLRAATGKDITAKHFRTWGGSVSACQYLNDHASEPPGRALERAMVKHVARTLGNTVTVARQFYIHPVLLAMAREHGPPVASRRRRRSLSPTESQLLRVLESAGRTSS